MIKDKLQKAYEFDLRSLGLFRVTLGICIFLDLIWRMGDLTAHYSDLGILTRSAWINQVAFDWSFSFHAFSGNPKIIAFIFLLHLFITFLFIIGHRTRLMTFLLFILTCSLHDRVWVFNNGGDDILRVILFFTMFLPLGHKFSVDSGLDVNSNEFPKTVFNVWVIGFTFQLFSVYFFSALLKNSPIWYKDFTATYFALMLDIFTLPLGKFIWQFPAILKGITIWSIWLEWAGALGILFIFVFGKWAPKVRLFLAINFILFHLGINLTMDIGIFPWIAICCWFVFIPSFVWDWFESRRAKLTQFDLKIYYDEGCSFCKKGVFILKSFFLMDKVEIKPAQSKFEIHEIMQQENSWVIVDGEGKTHTHFKAVIALVKASPLLRFFVKCIDNSIILKLGNRFYYFVSHNRRLMGKFTKPLSLETLPSLKISWISFLFGLFSLLLVAHWNIYELPEFKYKNKFLETSTQYLHLYQRWNMFAPYPKPYNIWFEVPAVLENGKEWELITDRRYTGTQVKENFYQSITNKQWRKFFLVLGEDHRYLKFYAEYFCKKWNILEDRTVDSKLDKFKYRLLHSEKFALPAKRSTDEIGALES